MSERSRKREVRDGVPHFLTTRGASNPFEFLSGVGVLIENCKRNDALGFRRDGLSIGEGLEKLREARRAVETAGSRYVKAGGGDNRDAWHFAMGEWVGYLEETTMLMHEALEQIGVEPDNSLLPVELPEIVPAEPV